MFEIIHSILWTLLLHPEEALLALVSGLVFGGFQCLMGLTVLLFVLGERG